MSPQAQNLLVLARAYNGDFNISDPGLRKVCRKVIRRYAAGIIAGQYPTLRNVVIAVGDFTDDVEFEH